MAMFLKVPCNWFVALVVLVVCTCSVPRAVAQTANLYVDASCGNDNWSGTSPVCAAPNGPKETIQAAVAAASADDVIQLADGQYDGSDNMNIVIDKDLVIRSESLDPDLCVIDLHDLGRAFRINGNTTMEGCVIKGITIKRGYVLPPGSTMLEPDGDENTEATGHGAAIEAYTPVTISNCIFENNQAPLGLGGAVYLGVDAISKVESCKFYSNGAAGGGGLFCISTGESEIRACHFETNSALWGGGGVMVWGYGAASLATQCALVGCVFEENTVGPSTFSCSCEQDYSWGGGLYVRERAVVKAVNCQFIENQAYAASGANAKGCGIAMHGIASIPALHAELELTNCLIAQNGNDDSNEANLSTSAGGILNSGGTLTIVNSTVAYNKTLGNDGGGGGLHHQCNADSSTTIHNSIFYGNTIADGELEQISLYMIWPCSTTTITMTNSDIQGGLGDIRGPDVPDVYTSNIDQDPYFVDALNGNFRLQ